MSTHYGMGGAGVRVACLLDCSSEKILDVSKNCKKFTINGGMFFYLSDCLKGGGESTVRTPPLDWQPA